MTDIVSRKKRSEMMSGIRSANTKPEIIVRRALHKEGFRYRLHDKSLPGKPDLVFPKYRAVIFVNGCFWHGHDCHLFKWPSTRPEWWRKKIEGNCSRDALARSRLKGAGWRQARIWECALKGRGRLDPDAIVKELAAWLDSARNELEIRGSQHD